MATQCRRRLIHSPQIKWAFLATTTCGQGYAADDSAMKISVTTDVEQAIFLADEQIAP